MNSELKYFLSGLIVGIILIILILYLLKISKYKFVQIGYAELINNQYSLRTLHNSNILVKFTYNITIKRVSNVIWIVFK